MGIAKIDYSLAQFDEKYDIYESEDRIFGRFDKLHKQKITRTHHRQV